MEVQPVLRRVQDLLKTGEVESAVRLIETLLPPDQADVMEELGDQDRRQIEPELTDEDLAHILERMDDYEAAEFAGAFDLQRLAAVVDAMAYDEAADLLNGLPEALRERTLANLENEAELRSLMAYPSDSAGGRMTTDIVRFPPIASVRSVWDSFREREADQAVIPYIFVVGLAGQLMGVVGLVELIRASPEDALEAVMKRDVVTVSAREPQETAARRMARHELAALPVLDDAGRLVGAITFDDAIEALEEEVTRDILNRGALLTPGGGELGRSQRLVRGPIWKTLQVRMPFLVITLFGGLLAGVVIDAFEGALQAVTALAVFIPVVMDMGGNSGTQSSTIFVRGLSLGQIDTSRFGRVLLREIGVGLGMGVVLGLGGGLIAQIWQREPGVGLVVGFSLLLTITLATFLGFFIPYLLHRAGVDAAAGADPIITTIKDITGLLVYFGLARLFMGALL
jgi:magnesium transporter